MPRDLDNYASNAARSLVLLHEQELRRFLVVWRRAEAAATRLPETDDPDYASLGALLRHVLGAARFYVMWMTERLEMAQPDIPEPPPAASIGQGCEAYVEEILRGWREALAGVPDAKIDNEAWPAPWRTPFTIDSMLEHAVIHPRRHAFQLEELMGE